MTTNNNSNPSNKTSNGHQGQKTGFQLEKYTPDLYLAELLKTNETNNVALTEKFSKLFAISEPILTPPSHVSLATLLSEIYNPESYARVSILNAQTASSQTQSSETPKRNINISALVLRTRRVAIKLAALIQINGVCPIKNYAITLKYNSILQFIHKKTFCIDLNQPLNSGLKITFNSTVLAIYHALQELESQIKELLPAILKLFGVNVFQPIMQLPEIQQAIEYVAPTGFEGIEPDYHYIFRWLLFPPVENFFPKMKKGPGFEIPMQWDYYANEFHLVFSLFLIRHKNGSSIPLDLSLFIKPTHYINIPYKTLLSMSTCSKTTASAVYNSAHILLPQLWLTAINHMHQINE